MNKPNGTKYPDSEPDTLGDLKSIKRLPGMSKHAPKIKWGDEYQSWPPEKRLNYAERLAASMNNAADLLQQERNDLIARAEAQELQIKAYVLEIGRMQALMATEIGRANSERQVDLKRLVELTSQVKELTATVEILEGLLED